MLFTLGVGCMNMTNQVKIDLIAYNSKDEEYKLILVEEGPWQKSTFEDRLRKIQDRIYNSVDAAIDGILMQKYPDSKGKKVCVQVDCYESPSDLVKQLVKGLDKYFSGSDEYQDALKRNKNISSFRIAYNEDKIKNTQQTALQ